MCKGESERETIEGEGGESEKECERERKRGRAFACICRASHIAVRVHAKIRMWMLRIFATVCDACIRVNANATTQVKPEYTSSVCKCAPTRTRAVR